MQLDTLTQAYLEAVLFTEEEQPEEEGLQNPSFDDFSPEAIEEAKADCEKLQTQYKNLLALAYSSPAQYAASTNPERGTITDSYGEEQAGHDLWLTRNGHGAGFWDRGLGVVGEKLSELCGYKKDCPFPPVDCYLGDDGKIYFS